MSGLGNIASVRRDKSRLDKALGRYEGALATIRNGVNKFGAADEPASTPSVSLDQEELDKALESCGEALETARRIGYKLGEAIELGGIGGVYCDKGELDRALRFHEDALAVARRIGYRIGVATALGNIGLILVKKGAHEQAVPHLVESLAIFLTIDVAHGPPQTLSGLSECDDALGWQRMVKLLREAGSTDQGIAHLHEQIDQLRRRRPRRRSSRPVRFGATGR